MYITPDENIEFGKIDRYDESIGFSQVNRFQNEDLIRIAMDYIGSEAKYSRIYDLYAGSGNFTFPLRNKFPNTPITAVELNPKLVQKGRELSKELNISYVEADVEAFSKKQKFEKTDLIFLDPPRAGTSKLIMEKVASSAAHKIIYISCHPVALARDLQWFFAKASELKINYKLNRVQTFEMFPQTDHVETIAELILDS
jgi:23S rRNA (uracil1939-C5)-methyltransferase